MIELQKNDIELQIERISAKGISLVPYIKRETCMDILDDLYGTLGWGVNYTPLQTADGLAMACSIEVYDSSNTHSTVKMNYGGSDSIKRLATDAFKRACKDWGIGRELNRLGESIIEAYINVGASRGSYELKGTSYESVGKGQGDYEKVININYNSQTQEFDCTDVFVISELYYHTDEKLKGRIGYIRVLDINTQQTVFILDELSELEKKQVNKSEKAKREAEETKVTNMIQEAGGFKGMDLNPDCGNERIKNKKIIDLTKPEAKAVFEKTQSIEVKEAIVSLQKLRGWS